jgi:hypothetical protein
VGGHVGAEEVDELLVAEVADDRGWEVWTVFSASSRSAWWRLVCQISLPISWLVGSMLLCGALQAL